jgi:hypothetical protein
MGRPKSVYRPANFKTVFEKWVVFYALGNESYLTWLELVTEYKSKNRDCIDSFPFFKICTNSLIRTSVIELWKFFSNSPSDVFGIKQIRKQVFTDSHNNFGLSPEQYKKSILKLKSINKAVNNLGNIRNQEYAHTDIFGTENDDFNYLIDNFNPLLKTFKEILCELAATELNTDFDPSCVYHRKGEILKIFSIINRSDEYNPQKIFNHLKAIDFIS